MKTAEQLQSLVTGLDGRDYAAYQSLKGGWRFGEFELLIDRIPKDPYAPPGTGVYRARVALERAGFAPEALATPGRARALRDFLARRFFEQCQAINGGRRGTGHSGVITICEPGQAVLERSSLAIDDGWVEARFSLGMPAAGRKIAAGIAATMLFHELPRIVEGSLFAARLDAAQLARHLEVAEAGEFLRQNLASRGLVAFVADGANLARASGVDARPLPASRAVPFKAPGALRVTFDLPKLGRVEGMGIPAGVTLIVGGGYHGKSTLLQALENGIYNHLPGDGREFCVSLPGTVKVRAASGRSVANADLSAFIANLPFGAATENFSTENASGSTSQAAFIAESVEAGAEVLLMDEDTCATNFMIRDQRMQQLVAKQDEPITAFVDRVRQLYEQHGVSTILVMGGSGDYFSVADTVIQMTRFEPGDVTDRAHQLAERFSTHRAPEGGEAMAGPRARQPLGEGAEPENEYGRVRISAAGPGRLIFGRHEVDLSDLEQLVETAQTRAIGRAILRAKPSMDGRTNLSEIARRVADDIETHGLDVLDPELVGDLAGFRALEFAATLNRMRGLAMRQEEPA